MKAKLLKKIRKRYTIVYWPNGVFLSGDFYEGPLLRLEDTNSMFRDCNIYITKKVSKEQAYDILYERLLDWIQQDYGTFRSRRVKIVSEKLWHGKDN